MSRRSLPSVFLDTDVAFDVISKREPHFEMSSAIIQMAAQGFYQLAISQSSIANLFYLAFESYKLTNASLVLKDMIDACEIISTSKETVIRALESNFKDKEDALQYFTALGWEIDYFVTRNKKDYRLKTTSLQVYTPQEFLQLVR